MQFLTILMFREQILQRNASFNYSILSRVVMHGAALMNATLVGVQMKRAELSNIIAIGLTLPDQTFHRLVWKMQMFVVLVS